MSECQFELKPLRCADCGAFIGTLGTCEDFAVCDRCAHDDLREYDASIGGYDSIYSPQYEEKDGELVITKFQRSKVPH